MLKTLFVLLLIAAVAVTGCSTFSPMTKSKFSSFKGVDHFADFTTSTNSQGETVLTSPKISAGMDWNQLIVSWNADAPKGTYVNVEAQAISPDHTTKYYTMGKWSSDNKAFKRTSVRGQKDADGNVKEDTMILTKFADAAQLRVTI